ncbi:hypothetical protein KEM60_00033 [Austwickia sp. TVS 96-490-7B]|uniref:DUF2516 family protein n=1 Tax=Austwickia sp. TVS 96-490-7B TaxID=2830843 RepID=UPI001C593985|nr:DUF2516 family protein [Austwickia sp. TVS 96-490-7B]MBW3083855.1 hypothetical protein [Austwickia sp. TVS 96-490-7B]
MTAIHSLQQLVMLVLGLAALGMEIFAFVEAVRYPAAAYAAAEKLTKAGWVGITGVAVLVGFVSVNAVLGIGLIAVVASGVFLADVRPAVRRYAPRRRGKGGPSGRGPYGSW